MSKIEKFRSIVREKAAAEVDGIEVDLFSASAVVKVYDSISTKNKERFLQEPAQVMVWLAFSILEKAKEGTR